MSIGMKNSMILERTIQEEIKIDWENVYTKVKADYDEWIQHNIDENVNPLNQSFNYDELEIAEHFACNVDVYLDIENLTQDEWNALADEFENYVYENKYIQKTD